MRIINYIQPKIISHILNNYIIERDRLLCNWEKTERGSVLVKCRYFMVIYPEIHLLIKI